MIRFKSSAVIACGFFTFSVMAYTSALALGVTSTGSASDIYKLFFKNIAVMFVFSCVLGASSLILKAKLAPAVKRVLHIFAVFAAYMISVLLMANPGKDARQIVLFVFIATLFYTVAYGATVLVSKALKKLI